MEQQLELPFPPFILGYVGVFGIAIIIVVVV